MGCSFHVQLGLIGRRAVAHDFMDVHHAVKSCERDKSIQVTLQVEHAGLWVFIHRDVAGGGRVECLTYLNA